jgi:predicted tellurium resistance membrane protein TerC
MELLREPQVWLSFLTLAALEIVLGIDNLIFLSILVGGLPDAQRRTARLLGLGFAMLTRLLLLFSIVWLTTLRKPLFALLGRGVSARELVLFLGGVFLVVQGAREIRAMRRGIVRERKRSPTHALVPVILQIGSVDILFSIDSVFTAVGLAKRVEVMAAAIVCAVLFMMVVSSAVVRFIDRYPTIKVLALAFIVLVGGALMADALDLTPPRGYLYFAMLFSAAVEWINIRLRKSPNRGS